MSQLAKIVAHVERNGSIDSWTAIRTYGITRLAARVFELKHTQDALVAIRSERLPRGFVLYVPNIPARIEVLKEELRRLSSDPFLTPEDIADQCVLLAMKANRLKEQRHG